MEKKLYDVALSFEEMKVLDGNVNEKAQKTIDAAKKENSFGFDMPIMNEILREAEQNGKLTWRFKQISNCKHCGKKRDYYTYTRNSRYHSRGDKNYDRPKYYSGIKFNEGCVTMQGYGDMCCDCEKEHKVIEKLIDYILDNDLKIEIQKNDHRETKYIKDPIKICFECGKEMRESKMGLLPAVMSGHYRGTCPHCGAEYKPFGKSHKSTNRFDFIEKNRGESDEI